jgi:hypothetical protein
MHLRGALAPTSLHCKTIVNLDDYGLLKNKKAEEFSDPAIAFFQLNIDFFF